jgi:multiple sugar transport system substrate-binding protein
MYKDDSVMNSLTEQVQYVRVGVLHPASRSIVPLIQAELQAVLMGKETSDQACTKLVPSINQAVKDSLALKP